MPDGLNLLSLALAFAAGVIVAAPLAVAIYRRRVVRYGLPEGTVVGVLRHRPRTSEIFVSLVELPGACSAGHKRAGTGAAIRGGGGLRQFSPGRTPRLSSINPTGKEVSAQVTSQGYSN